MFLTSNLGPPSQLVERLYSDYEIDFLGTLQASFNKCYVNQALNMASKAQALCFE